MCSFTIFISNLVACTSDISHGLIWEGQSENTTTFKRCSELHRNFRSGTRASRKCNAKGEWENVNLTDCTMYAYTDPVVVAQATITPANQSVIVTFNASVSRLNSVINFWLCTVTNT